MNVSGWRYREYRWMDYVKNDTTEKQVDDLTTNDMEVWKKTYCADPKNLETRQHADNDALDVAMLHDGDTYITLQSKKLNKLSKREYLCY